jgi:hypothetical protein
MPDIAARQTAQWSVDGAGEIVSHDGPQSVSILWKAGAIVGVATYNIADGFSYRREVNVVKIDLDVANSSLTYGADPGKSNIGSAPAIDSTNNGSLAVDGRLNV